MKTYLKNSIKIALVIAIIISLGIISKTTQAATTEEAIYGLFKKSDNPVPRHYSKSYFNGIDGSDRSGSARHVVEAKYNNNSYAIDVNQILPDGYDSDDVQSLIGDENRVILLDDKEKIKRYIKQELSDADKNPSNEWSITGWRFVMYNIARVDSVYDKDKNIATENQQKSSINGLKNNYNSPPNNESSFRIMEENVRDLKITLQYLEDIDEIKNPFGKGAHCEQHYCNLLKKGNLKFNTAYFPNNNDVFKYDHNSYQGNQVVGVERPGLVIAFWDEFNDPVTIIRVECANPIADLHKEKFIYPEASATITTKCDGSNATSCNFDSSDGRDHTIKFNYKMSTANIPNGSWDSNVCFDLFKRDSGSANGNLSGVNYSGGSTTWGGTKSCINDGASGAHHQVSYGESNRIGSFDVYSQNGSWSGSSSETITFKPSEIATDSRFTHTAGGHTICRQIDYGPALKFSFNVANYVEKRNEKLSNASGEACITVTTNAAPTYTGQERLWIVKPDKFSPIATNINSISSTNLGLESYAQRVEQWSFLDDDKHNLWGVSGVNKKTYSYSYPGKCESSMETDSNPNMDQIEDSLKKDCDDQCKNDDDKIECSFTTESENTTTFVEKCEYEDCDKTCVDYDIHGDCVDWDEDCDDETANGTGTEVSKTFKCTFRLREPKVKWQMVKFIIRPSANSDANYSMAATTSPTDDNPYTYYSKGGILSEYRVIRPAESKNNKDFEQTNVDFGARSDDNKHDEIVKTLITPFEKIGVNVNNPDGKGFNQTDFKIPTVEEGSQVCFGLSVTPWHFVTNGNGSGKRTELVADGKWMHSEAVCTKVTKKPFAQVVGDDLYADKVKSDRNYRLSAGEAWTQLSSVDSGSFTEYAIIARRQLDNVFRSNNFLGYELNNTKAQLHRLTFTNNNPNKLGRTSGVSKTNITALASSIRSTCQKGLCTVHDGDNPGGLLSCPSANNKCQLVSNSTPSNPSRIGDYKPHIIILDKPGSELTINVNKVDSWLIVNGTIKTCDGQPTSDSCKNNQLIVNGPVIAKDIELKRGFGAGYNSLEDELSWPAEVFNSRPIDYIWGYNTSADSGQIHTVYSRDVAPRY